MSEVSLLAVVGAITSIILGVAATYAVLSPRVHTGLIIMVGLVAVAIGSFGHAALVLTAGFGCGELVGFARAALLTRIGLLVVVGGWLLRAGLSPYAPKRTSDWMGLGERRGSR